MILASAPRLAAAKLPYGVTVLSGTLVEGRRWTTTGPDAVILRIGADSTIKISPDSRLRLEHFIKLSLGDRRKTHTLLLRLEHGKVETNLPDKKQIVVAVLVRGPNALSTVAMRGRSVTAARDGKLAAAAHTHSMMTAHKGHWDDLGAGLTALGVRREGYSSAVALLSRPKDPRLGQAIVGAFETGQAFTNAIVEAVPNARSYHFQVREDGKLVASARSDTLEAKLTGIPPGVFSVSVSALDEMGLESPASRGTTFRVVGVKLPEDAVQSEDGTIFLAHHQGLQLVGILGLEAGFGQYPYFVPAPERVGLTRQRPTTMILRDPRTHDSVQMRLRPRQLTATTTFHAVGQEWPKDGLGVEVKLADSSGRAIDESSEPNIELSFNARAVAATWEQDGDVRTTTLKMPQGVGPWAVRLDITDAWGQNIGHEILELDRPKPAVRGANPAIR
ncbi:MAG: hypothetical protein HRU17_04430 [Polyangiaceae bacterium]|nr:hypothetical protein [Polyangiaceae bacterium]